MKRFCVYKHTFPNGKVYIGITSKKPEERWQNGKGYTSNKHLQNAIRKYGWINIKHDVLLKNLNDKEAKFFEIYYIKLYKSTDKQKGYNISLGGNIISEETKKKISSSHMGIKPNEEARLKMRQAKLGKKQSKETIQKRIRKGKDNPLFGRFVSEQERDHLRNLFKGKPAHINTIRANYVKIIQCDKEGKVIAEFESIKEASSKLNISYQKICHNCNGHQKFCNGYVFKHKEKN